MVLVRNGQVVTDEWDWVADAEPVPDNTAAVVSLARWRAERAQLLHRSSALGVRLAGADDVAGIAGDIAHFGLIALEFSAFTDGRAYSSARLLRERHGFTGELRAVGEVLRDQFAFMLRCGFDAFEVRESDAGAWSGAVREAGVRYQPAADGLQTAMQLRHRKAAAE